MKNVTFPSGIQVPALGMGTWNMGEQRAARAEEIACLRRGIELGMSVIDTAEMYGEGAAERLVGEAIAGQREQVFLVSKFYPQNAGRRGVPAACERSLSRLKSEYIDLYLLHWRGNVPFAETVEALEDLKQSGKIRQWGVSNLDLADMTELFATPGGNQVATNQVLYNLSRRGVEWDLLPWCAQNNIPVMAYSPVEQGRLLRHKALSTFAAELGVPSAQLALAWVLARENTLAIPKAARLAHVEDNFAASSLKLDQEILDKLNQIFQPPTQASPLEML